MGRGSDLRADRQDWSFQSAQTAIARSTTAKNHCRRAPGPVTFRSSPSKRSVVKTFEVPALILNDLRMTLLSNPRGRAKQLARLGWASYS
jgi:hypothetical protein